MKIKEELGVHLTHINILTQRIVILETETEKNDEMVGEIGKLKSSKAEASLVAHHYIEVSKKLECLEDNLSKLRKEFESKLEVDLEKWREYYSKVYVKKTPHKCPICDGTGNLKKATRENPNFDFYVEYASCHACDGKGVVWG